MDPRSEEGERIGMSRYCDHMERRIAELEAALRKIANGEIDQGGNRRNHSEGSIIAREVLGIKP